MKALTSRRGRRRGISHLSRHGHRRVRRLASPRRCPFRHLLRPVLVPHSTRLAVMRVRIVMAFPPLVWITERCPEDPPGAVPY